MNYYVTPDNKVLIVEDAGQKTFVDTETFDLNLKNLAIRKAQEIKRFDEQIETWNTYKDEFKKLTNKK